MRIECALQAGSDPLRHARRLSRAWRQAIAGGRPEVSPRPLIAESWERARSSGLDPWRGPTPPRDSPLEVQQRRQESRLGEIRDILSCGLASFADDGVHVMAIADHEGRLLWLEGSSAVRDRVDAVGFCEGAQWTETTAGTTAVGTTLVAQCPLQVFAAEHFVRSLHSLVCTAAPLRDPVDGRLLGVVDVSGPAATVHPSTVALVASVAEIAERTLRTAHRGKLEHLRVVAAPVLARIRTPALVVDRNGWVAAATGILPPDRVLLPEPLRGGMAYVTPLGRCQLEPLFDGWLIQAGRHEACHPTAVTLDLRAAAPLLVVASPSGTWRHRLSPRHGEILFLLARSPSGYSAAELSADLYGDPRHTVAVRSELSRLRHRLGSLISHRPYRFQPWLEVSYELPDDPAQLLPAATALTVRKLRTAASEKAAPS